MCPSRWAWYGELELLDCDGAPVGWSQWVAVRVGVFAKALVAAIGEKREEAGSSAAPRNDNQKSKSKSRSRSRLDRKSVV